MTKSNRYWTLIVVLLLAIIVCGSLIIWSKYDQSQPVEISISPGQETPIAEFYIGGAVNNSGAYPLKSQDTINDIIQAAGGTAVDADRSQLELYIPSVGEEAIPQKINLNRADVWLLQALPGIGETRAQAIVDYRQQNGAFHNTGELIKVAGIGTATYEKIKSLITIVD